RILHGCHVEPSGLQSRNHFRPARAIGKKTVNQHYIFCFGRGLCESCACRSRQADKRTPIHVAVFLVVDVALKRTDYSPTAHPSPPSLPTIPAASSRHCATAGPLRCISNAASSRYISYERTFASSSFGNRTSNCRVPGSSFRQRALCATSKVAT